MAVDIKKWLEEKAAEIGLDDTEKSAAAKLLNSDRFKGDFVGLPDFHSALDKQKRTFSQQVESLQELNSQWQDEYENKYAPALDAVKRLETAGYDVAGLQNMGNGVVGGGGAKLSAEDVERMIAERLEPIRAGAVEYGTFVADKALEHHDTYGKRFNAAAYRKFAYDNRSEYPTLAAAYDAFTAEDRAAKEVKDKEDWKQSEREKIRLELQSTESFPEQSTAGNAPIFNAILEVSKDDAETRDKSRQEFAKTFANADFSKLST